MVKVRMVTIVRVMVVKVIMVTIVRVVMVRVDYVFLPHGCV